MTNEDRELCGGECADGSSCQNYADTCPWDHGGDNQNGRDSLFNDETRTACIDAAKEGKSKAGCARAAGVDESTLRGWLSTDEDFFRAFTRARAKGESKLIEHGMYSPDVDASMAKFLLASSFDYVKTSKQEVEHTGEDGGPIEVNIGGDGK